MKAIAAVLDDLPALIALEPEELGGLVVEYLNSLPEEALDARSGLHETIRSPGEFPVEFREDVLRAFQEAWHWLDREGLVLRRPYSKRYYVTRRGQRLRSARDVSAYVQLQKLPRHLLHPRIVERSWPAILRGDMESAVFVAFREVEIVVREHSELSDADLGTALMRKAFDPRGGPLTNEHELESEREALSHLFAGAIGRFKNPASHRTVQFGVADVFHLLTIASFLMNTVEERAVTR